MVNAQNIDAVIARLKKLVRQWAVPVVGHYREDPFTTLVSCLLSLRTKDAVTLAGSMRLFALARDPHRLLALPVAEIEKAIYPVAFYRTKARGLQELCRVLIERHGGRVPADLETLLELPGVGRKTANLVITLAFGQYGICVDTHVHRISNRWGYVKTRLADETEMALRKKLPKKHWKVYNDLLVAFGQNLCQPVSPWCSRCPVERECAKAGLRYSR